MRCSQDRRFPSIDSSLGAARTFASPSVDERLLPAGLSHDAAASAPWLTRRSVSGPLARVSVAAAEKTSPSDDTTCCNCRLCRAALLRLLVILFSRYGQQYGLMLVCKTSLPGYAVLRQ